MVTAVSLSIPDVMLVKPTIYKDARGSFQESYNARAWNEALGQSLHFVQDNHSVSHQYVLRGLHYQVKQPQGKLVRVVQGVIYDVAIDIRRSSPTFGKWVGVELSADTGAQLWVPPGFAHGFVVLSNKAEVFYKTTDYYAPEHERTILWKDPLLAIDWAGVTQPQLSAKDVQGLTFENAPYFD